MFSNTKSSTWYIPSFNLYSTQKSPVESSYLSTSNLLSNASMLTHAEENDLMDWEGMTLTKAMFAGSLAGMTEHACMFPVDTIKTRMQAVSSSGVPIYTNVLRAVKEITQKEGFTRLYRGLPVTMFGAIPSHAAYFGTYESMKLYLGASRKKHTPLQNMASGISATLAHDAIATPMDVVKQRLQVFNSPHTGILNCVKHIWSKEGLIGFYRSYPATVLLNVPYMAVHFATYEGMHTLYHDTPIDDTPLADITSGACAGALGGLVSNPLDVLKTRMQTQSGDRIGTWAMLKRMYSQEGLKVFGRGATARMLLFTPSAAICWTVYEGLKRFLLPQSQNAAKKE